jgi:ADP-ribosylglycohydrolase
MADPTIDEPIIVADDALDPRERFRGCLLGGAVGDALGAPVEFMSHAEILRTFGSGGITGYVPTYGGIGRITDDTQLTLFTAEGLLRAWVRGCVKGVASVPDLTRQAYLRWLRTQHEGPVPTVDARVPLDGWLIRHRQLHSRRDPGNTCLGALRDARVHEGPARNNSKGCGGVMRMAPVGLFLWMPETNQAPRHAFQLATELAAITHGHPTGQLAAGAFAVLILGLVDGAGLPEAIAIAKAELVRHAHHEETLRAIEQAEILARSDLSQAAALGNLGHGWVAEEALATSIYCALVAPSFREAVRLAIHHDGDSDTTGSITGNLCGALHGVSAIPEEWLEPLELRHVITEIADDLHDYRDWDLGGHSKTATLNARIWGKYPA